MSAQKGRSLRVKVSTVTGGPFNVVAGIESGSFDRDGQNVDVTTLTDADIVRIQALKDAKISLSGNYEGGDTNGQVVIFSAYDAGTTVFVEFLPDGTTGWKKEFCVGKISLSGASKDKQAISIDLEGTGATSTV